MRRHPSAEQLQIIAIIKTSHVSFIHKKTSYDVIIYVYVKQ